MRHFLYDEVNKRLVLVDGLWPSIELEKADRFVTPNSNQARIYNSLYVWEGVTVEHPINVDVSFQIWTVGSKENKNRIVMELPSNDTCMIYGGVYQYNLPKPA